MASRNTVRHRLGQRHHDRVHDGRHDGAPARHGCRKFGHHDVAFRNDDLERAERTLVDRVERTRERLVGDTRAGIGARIDSSLALGRAAGQVDCHVAALDRDLDADRDFLVADQAVVIDRSLGFVDTVGKLHHHVTALLLGLVEDLRNGGEDRVLAVLVEQLVHAARGKATGGHLRFHIAERRLRKPNVVLDHAVERLVELAFLVDLELVELEPFEPGIRYRRAGPKSSALSADVDPVRPHHAEHQQLPPVEIGHVDDNVVEMLSGHRLMIGDNDVARLESVAAVALHAVDDEDAEIGNEVGDAADILRNQLAVRVEQRGAIVADLVDHHVVGGPLQIGGHLVGDGRQRVAEHLERDGVELHRLPPIPMMSSPDTSLDGRTAFEFGKVGICPAEHIDNSGAAQCSPVFGRSSTGP